MSTLSRADRILDKLGLVTKNRKAREAEEFRHKCEEFAKDYLDYPDGVTFGAMPGRFLGGEIKRPAVIIGNDVEISESRVNGLVAAPWVDRLVIRSCITAASSDPTVRVRALVRIVNPKPDDINNAELITKGAAEHGRSSGTKLGRRAGLELHADR